MHVSLQSRFILTTNFTWLNLNELVANEFARSIGARLRVASCKLHHRSVGVIVELDVKKLTERKMRRVQSSQVQPVR